MALTEQEIIRRNSLKELRNLGIDPYPAAEYPVNVTAKEIHENFLNDNKLYQEVSLAGRIMSRRIMGAASFAELKDPTGRMNQEEYRSTCGVMIFVKERTKHYITQFLKGLLILVISLE